MSKTFASQDTAERYDSARALPDETLALWMDTLRGLLPCISVSSILDLGAGTGRFSAALQQAFGCRVIAVDPSEAMLDQGRCRGLAGITWQMGSAESIPLDDRSADLVWMSQVFHHLDCIPTALCEIRRVLKPGGQLAVRNATVESNEEAVYPSFFPEARAINDERLPSRRDVLCLLADSGFEKLEMRTVYQVFTSSHAEYLDKIGQRGLSDLVAISDEAFDAGMHRLTRWVAEQPDNQPVTEPIDLFVASAAIEG